MTYEVNGATIAANANGYLEKVEDWSEELAAIIADGEGIELSEKHWDLINFLRDEFINKGGNQPNDRNIVKAMSKAWPDEKVDSKSTYILFPKQPSKQASKIAGLPESRRKGGY